jgi:transcriptional regulator with XRE-family HTH domain
MVVLEPLLEGERRKRCECGHVGLASLVPARSSFARVGGGSRFRDECRACAQRARDRVKEEQQDRRIDEWEPREAAGEKLPSREKVRGKTGTFREPVLIEPIQAWVRDLIERERAMCTRALPKTPYQEQRYEELLQGDVARRLGLSPRQMYRWMNEGMEEIDFGALDRAASSYGYTTAEEILRTYGNPTQEVEIISDRATKTRRCRFRLDTARLCGEAVEEGRFCVAHAEELARIAGLLQEDADRFRGRIKRKGTRSTCCRPGCTNERLQVERYCFECQDKGWDEADLV